MICWGAPCHVSRILKSRRATIVYAKQVVFSKLLALTTGQRNEGNILQFLKYHYIICTCFSNIMSSQRYAPLTDTFQQVWTPWSLKPICRSNTHVLCHRPTTLDTSNTQFKKSRHPSPPSLFHTQIHTYTDSYTHRSTRLRAPWLWLWLLVENSPRDILSNWLDPVDTWLLRFTSNDCHKEGWVNSVTSFITASRLILLDKTNERTNLFSLQ